MNIELHENEKIKAIQGFEKYYITTQGRVYSTVTNKWLKPTINKRGNHERLYVSLGRGNKRYIHRLVAEAFIPNPNNFQEVDHIDTNAINNNVNNLHWVTRKGNMKNILTKEHLKKNGSHIMKEIENIQTGEKYWGFKEASEKEQVHQETIRNHTKNRVKNPKWKLTGRIKDPITNKIIISS